MNEKNVLTFNNNSSWLRQASICILFFPMIVISLAPSSTLVTSKRGIGSSIVQQELSTFKSTTNPKFCSLQRNKHLSAFVPRSVTSRLQSTSTSSSSSTNTTLTPKPSESPSKISSSSSKTSSSSSSKATKPTKKSKLLKDKMWIRETLEDLTAAEFASSLDARRSSSSSSGDGDENERDNNRKKAKRAVDYENLLSKLDLRIREMVCESPTGGVLATGDINDEGCDVIPKYDIDDGTFGLSPSDSGMGSLTYNIEKRQDLLGRIIRTRETLVHTMKGQAESTDEEDEDNNKTPFAIELPEIPEIRVEIPKESSPSNASSSSSPSSSSSSTADLYLRDDGTVDWDGALQDRAALKKFGTAVWARINGQDPDNVDEESIAEGKNAGAFSESSEKVVTAKIKDTEAIRKEKALLDTLTTEYNDMKTEHIRLLNSAISAGQAVANINLATLNPSLRNKIRQSESSLEKMKEEVSFQSLIYEMERIYTYLDGELSTSLGYIPLQERLNVAEFSLLESQIESLNLQLEAGDIVDADVLAVVMEQLNDFKRRLGIDYYVTGLTFDQEAIQRWLAELLSKTKDGLAFYVKGCRLFWNDIIYSTSLIGRALQGYTLKPREVRNLRRTFKDTITFIPVVIILLIPLSPVGHVLVFGAIQRFFPGFFPSCFTEQRQNLLQLYESTEYTELTINETWQEKLTRIITAIVFLIGSNARMLYNKLTGSSVEDDDSKAAKS